MNGREVVASKAWEQNSIDRAWVPYGLLCLRSGTHDR
jgi:hypothetical protein